MGWVQIFSPRYQIFRACQAINSNNVGTCLESDETKLPWDCVGAMVTTGGELSDEWDVYTNGGGPLFGVVDLGLVVELPGCEPCFGGVSSVNKSHSF